MPALRLVLGDQLSRGLSALRDLRTGDVVLMIEAADECRFVKHHQQKLALILSGMRHFAEELRRDHIDVDYVRLDDPQNVGNLTGELQRALQRHRVDHVIVTEPGDWRLRQMLPAWQRLAHLDVRTDDRFLCSVHEFSRWAERQRRLRMDAFYRYMRTTTEYLVTDEERPVGGKWSFDVENRRRLPEGQPLPSRRRFAPDPTTREVLELVAGRFGDHFGELASFGWAVTRSQALKALDDFIAGALPCFGDYQDAMKQDAPFLFHAVLSPYLNLGLLRADEVCEAALDAWQQGRAPLNAVEGFVRQVIGWREFIRGIYHLKMPGYARSNFLRARRQLPWFYWSGQTDMNCLRQCITATRQNAYAHHIQRLMVTGNFALLAGCKPAEVEAWYLIVYADAWDWVELPNVHGMALYADGGVLATKPYAASGAYINRMSDYCRHCVYSPSRKTGPKACPFNYLYWHFLIRNASRLATNLRLSMPYATLARKSDGERRTLERDARAFLRRLK